MKRPSVTIVIPVYNGASTLRNVFESLATQQDLSALHEIIAIDDASVDGSTQLLEELRRTVKLNIRIIKHPATKGLAYGYNEGIAAASTDIVVLMHQDIQVLDHFGLAKAVAPLQQASEVVISYPTLLHPIEVWAKYNFWQKILFSRLAGTKKAKFTGKFDAIRKIPGLKFDEVNYRTAGEDLDYEMRAKAHGRAIASGVEIVHLHNLDPSFSFAQLLKKEAQLGECYGVNLRRYNAQTSWTDKILLCTRPGLLIFAFVPFFNVFIVAWGLILIFTILYTKRMISLSRPWVAVSLIPINLISMFAYSVFFIKGAVVGRQSL